CVRVGATISLPYDYW
nr:immunoglobulin heavy chain junction region [Macaca mulatta]